VEVAIAKARTAAMFRAPTSRFADMLAQGASGLVTLPDMLPIPGGVPVMVDGVAVGAVGVSGAPPAVDGKIAAAAAAIVG
jgi:glc operon protein GlcG